MIKILFVLALAFGGYLGGTAARDGPLPAFKLVGMFGVLPFFLMYILLSRGGKAALEHPQVQTAGFAVLLVGSMVMMAALPSGGSTLPWMTQFGFVVMLTFTCLCIGMFLLDRTFKVFKSFAPAAPAKAGPRPAAPLASPSGGPARQGDDKDYSFDPDRFR